MKKKIVVGVTGGLATGKTTVTGMLVRKGARRIDADKIAHVLLSDRDVRKKIIDVFGEDILSAGRVDRKKLRARVFADGRQLAKLNGIVHPLVIRRLKKEIKRCKRGVVVIDAALLIEKKLHNMVDLLVVVASRRENQVRRAIKKGFSREDAEKVIAAQLPLSSKVKMADHVIQNDGRIENVKKGVGKLWKRIQGL